MPHLTAVAAGDMASSTRGVDSPSIPRSLSLPLLISGVSNLIFGLLSLASVVVQLSDRSQEPPLSAIGFFWSCACVVFLIPLAAMELRLYSRRRRRSLDLFAKQACSLAILEIIAVFGNLLSFICGLTLTINIKQLKTRAPADVSQAPKDRIIKTAMTVASITWPVSIVLGIVHFFVLQNLRSVKSPEGALIGLFLGSFCFPTGLYAIVMMFLIGVWFVKSSGT